MAGRNRIHREVYDYHRGYAPDFPVVGAPLARPIPHPALLEEELEIRHAELCTLHGENRRLVEDRIALDRELVAAGEELRRMNHVIAEMRAEQEAYSRELFERCRKMEADLRAAEPLINEAAQLRAEVQRLNTIKQDLYGKLQNMTPELEKLRNESDQLPALRSEIDGLHQELLRSRSAIDYEKTANAHLLVQRQALENNMVSMARELEKLRADHANSGGRSWSAGGTQGLTYANTTSNFPSTHASGYGIRQGEVDKATLYSTGSASWTSYENSWLGRR